MGGNVAPQEAVMGRYVIYAKPVSQKGKSL